MRSILAGKLRPAGVVPSTLVRIAFMIDLPTRPHSAGGKRLWVRALQRADHEADALSSGWRGCRRFADIDEREVMPRVVVARLKRDRLVNGCACAAAMAADASAAL